MSNVRIVTQMGCDPGSSNFGFSVVKCKFVDNKLVAVKVLENGKLKNMFKVMQGTHVRDQRRPFLYEVQKIMRKHKCKNICLERYMNRGIRGNTSELVNIMMGVLLSIESEFFSLFSAAQWKNRWKHLGDLKATYKYIKTEAHQLDATSIAIYGACQLVGCEDYFSNLNLHKLIIQIESTSTEKLINRVTRKCPNSLPPPKPVPKQTKSRK